MTWVKRMLARGCTTMKVGTSPLVKSERVPVGFNESGLVITDKVLRHVGTSTPSLQNIVTEMARYSCKGSYMLLDYKSHFHRMLHSWLVTMLCPVRSMSICLWVFCNPFRKKVTRVRNVNFTWERKTPEKNIQSTWFCILLENASYMSLRGKWDNSVKTFN